MIIPLTRGILWSTLGFETVQKKMAIDLPALVSCSGERDLRSCVIYFFFQPHNKKLPCCLYLAALAITDNLFIINCLELVLMMGFFPDHFKDIHCKFVSYHFQVSEKLLYIDCRKKAKAIIHIGNQPCV